VVVGWFYVMTVATVIYVTLAFPRQRCCSRRQGKEHLTSPRAPGKVFDKLFPEDEGPNGGVSEG
jgi:hypothetical protein